MLQYYAKMDQEREDSNQYNNSGLEYVETSDSLCDHEVEDLGAILNNTSEEISNGHLMSPSKWWNSQTILLWHLRILFLLFPCWPAQKWWQLPCNRVFFVLVVIGMLINNAFMIGSLQQLIDDVKYIADGHFFFVAVVYVIVSYVMIGHYLNWNHFKKNGQTDIVPHAGLMTGKVRARYLLPRSRWIITNIILVLSWLILVIGVESYRLAFYKTYHTPLYVVQSIFSDISNLTVVVACTVFYVATEIILINIQATEKYIMSHSNAGLLDWKAEVNKLLLFCDFLVSTLRPWFIILVLFCFFIVGIIAYNGIVNGFGKVEELANAPFDKVQYVGFSLLVFFVLSFSFFRASAVTKRFRTLSSNVHGMDVESKDLEYDKFLFLCYVDRCNPGFKVFGINVTFGFALFSVLAGFGQAVSVLRKVLK